MSYCFGVIFVYDVMRRIQTNAAHISCMVVCGVRNIAAASGMFAASSMELVLLIVCLRSRSLAVKPMQAERSMKAIRKPSGVK